MNLGERRILIVKKHLLKVYLWQKHLLGQDWFVYYCTGADTGFRKGGVRVTVKY